MTSRLPKNTSICSFGPFIGPSYQFHLYPIIYICPTGPMKEKNATPSLYQKVLWPQKCLLQRDLFMQLLHRMIFPFYQLYEQTLRKLIGICELMCKNLKMCWIFFHVKPTRSTVGEYWKEEKRTAMGSISLFKQFFVSSAHFVNHSIPTDKVFGLDQETFLPSNHSAFGHRRDS